MKRYNLYNLRNSKKMTQEQVAKCVGISKQQYNRIENGEQFGSIRVWDALEDLFCIPQRQLRENNETENTTKKPDGNPAKR